MKVVDDVIDAVIAAIQPLNKEEPFLHQLMDDSIGITTHSIRSATHNKVTKIDLFTVSDMNSYPLKPLGIIVQMTERDGEVTLSQLEPEVLEKIKSQLQLANIYPEAAFLRPRLPALAASEFNNLQIYDTNTHSDYEIIRQSIADDVLNFMQKQSNLDVLLIDVGTGLGDCLDLTVKMMQTLSPKVRAIGIDPNQESILTAQMKFPDYVFKIGEAHSLEKIVEEEKLQNNMKHALVVITASGSITRLVINNTLDALEVFQQAHRVADLMVLGGENEVLITRKNAKKIGWNAQYHPSKLNDSNLVYLLTKKDIHFPKIREGHLNLSLHANPLLILNHYANDLKKITSIDLGLAYIKQEEIEQMLKLMPQLKNLKISGLEKWKSTLEGVIKSRDLEIIISANTGDYVDTELDLKKWELKKFTSRFYRQHSKMFALFNRSILSLEQGMSSAEYKPNDKESPQEYIVRLEALANKGDDIAVYALAKKLAEEVTSDSFKNLQTSAIYWSQLYEKGYPVLFELIKVQKLIETMDPLQDLYAKLNEALSKHKAAQ